MELGQECIIMKSDTRELIGKNGFVVAVIEWNEFSEKRVDSYIISSYTGENLGTYVYDDLIAEITTVRNKDIELAISLTKDQSLKRDLEKLYKELS